MEDCRQAAQKYRCCRIQTHRIGVNFPEYISDAFEELYAKLKADEANGADREDKDEYKAENVFFVPPSARWKFLQSHAKQPTIGITVDAAMDAI